MACQGVVDPVGLVVLTTSTSEVQRMSSERCGGGGMQGACQGMEGDGVRLGGLEGVFHAWRVCSTRQHNHSQKCRGSRRQHVGAV